MVKVLGIGMEMGMGAGMNVGMDAGMNMGMGMCTGQWAIGHWAWA